MICEDCKGVVHMALKVVWYSPIWGNFDVGERPVGEFDEFFVVMSSNFFGKVE